MFQRKDIAYLLSKVAKQWKLRNNGHLTYMFIMTEVSPSIVKKLKMHISPSLYRWLLGALSGLQTPGLKCFGPFGLALGSLFSHAGCGNPTCNIERFSNILHLTVANMVVS